MSFYEHCKANGTALHPNWNNPKGREGYALGDDSFVIFQPDKDKFLWYKRPTGQ
jgi:hypothetical protein